MTELEAGQQLPEKGWGRAFVKSEAPLYYWTFKLCPYYLSTNENTHTHSPSRSRGEEPAAGRAPGPWCSGGLVCSCLRGACRPSWGSQASGEGDTQAGTFKSGSFL